MIPIVLTIAGSDSGGGAGIQADIKAISALGGYAASALTAITAQNTLGVQAITAVAPQMVRAQIGSVLDDLAVGAVKIGMLGSPEVTEAVGEALRGCGLPIVLDPVMVAKSGDRLLAEAAISALREVLVPQASCLTPNLPEAAVLLGTDPAPDEAAQAAQGQALLALGPQWVLMKGGHGHGPQCVDLLLGAKPQRLAVPRQAARHTHGTGCTLSAAIALGLAQGLAMPQAVQQAHDYLQGAIAAAARLKIGQGIGPVDHFHAMRPAPLPLCRGMGA